MNKKKTIIILVIGILIVITLSIGVTYSYMKPKVEKENNQTEIGINNCANLTLKEKNKTINLTNMYPMEEEMALQKDDYEFTISNTCEEYTGFSLYLTTLNDNGIEDSNIRYAITDLGNNVLISDVLSKRPNGISDFSEEELKQLDTEINGTHKNIYKIYGSTISINRNNKYKLYLWLDEKAGNDTMGKSFTVGLTTKINEEEKNYVKDLSGNNYDGVMQNGALIKLDDEERQGLYFDGEDDYVDIVDLPETINWDGGFTIEFEAKWLAFNSWSRIFDFGNGPDNDDFFVANGDTRNVIGIFHRYGSADIIGMSASISNIILKERQNYKIEVIKNGDFYTFNIYKDNAIILNKITDKTNFAKNIKRTENFLGKSQWSTDGYFNGYIYNLKITDASDNVILWYDFTNETIKDLSGNGNNGINNGATITDEGITTNDSDKVTYVNLGLINYDFDTSVSFVARVKFNQIDGLQEFMNNFEDAGVGLGLNSNYMYINIYDLDTNPPGYKTVYNRLIIVPTEWYTVVGTYDGTNLKLYINGQEEASINLSGRIKPSPAPVLLGGNLNIQQNSYFVSNPTYTTFSDTLIFNRALTQEEILENYQEIPNPVNKQDLLLWYKF